MATKSVSQKTKAKVLSREDGKYFCISPLLPFPWHLKRITERYDPAYLAHCQRWKLDPRGKHYFEAAERMRIEGMTEGQLANDLYFDDGGNARTGEL